MPLNIVIAGAGIAGLTAAIALSNNWPAVRVYERRRDDDDSSGSGSGIQLQPNAIRVLRKIGIMDSIDAIGTENHQFDMREHQTGRTMVLVDMDYRGGARYAIRRDLKKCFINEALQRGVKLYRGKGVVSVRASDVGAVVELDDGTITRADLVIGADGTYSRVRRSLYPDYHPKVLDTLVFQCQVPLNSMTSQSSTKELLRNEPALGVIASPGRATVVGPDYHTKLLDFQSIDADQPLRDDPFPDVRLGWVGGDMDRLRQRYSDHESGVRQVLEAADRYYKWRLVEVSDLPSWSDASGRILLIGDAAHAMTPYSGQGSAMGIEDAAVINELLASASPGDNLQETVRLFEELRRPRCEKVKKYADSIGKIWGAKEEKVIKRLRDSYAYINNSEEYAKAQPSMNAPYSSFAFNKWLDVYDASEEVRKALKHKPDSLARL